VKYAATNDEMQVRDSRGITDDKKINFMKISRRKISQKNITLLREYYDTCILVTHALSTYILLNLAIDGHVKTYPLFYKVEINVN